MAILIINELFAFNILINFPQLEEYIINFVFSDFLFNDILKLYWH